MTRCLAILLLFAAPLSAQAEADKPSPDQVALESALERAMARQKRVAILVDGTNTPGARRFIARLRREKLG